MPLPAAKPDVVPPIGRLERHVEMPHRRHHLERVAGLEGVVRPRREHAAGIALDRDAQRPVLHAGADRIRPAHVLPADVRAQRQVLAGREPERLGQRLGNGERDRDGIARLARDARDRQAMEFAHCGPLKIEPVSKFEAAFSAV